MYHHRELTASTLYQHTAGIGKEPFVLFLLLRAFSIHTRLVTMNQDFGGPANTIGTVHCVQGVKWRNTQTHPVGYRVKAGGGL